jgi:hypothetical protein
MVAMETKKKATAVVTEATAQASLRAGSARALTAEEERVLRMRLGAAPSRTAPLEKAAPERSDLEIELLSYEIEAYLRHREAQGARAPAPAKARVATPAPSRAKEKIIRALRKKA